MAREKKSMIGFDPLAWLGDDKQKDKSVAKKTQKKPATKAKKKNEKVPAKIITVLGHEIDESALLKGYALATDALDEAVADFYNELFSQHPALKPLFEKTDEKKQAGKLAAALKLLVDNLHNEEALKTTLSVMGERHQNYGALPEHYPVVAELLVASFKNKIGRSWTKAISAAWMEMLVAAAETMCAAYKTQSTEDDVSAESEAHIEQEIKEMPAPELPVSELPVAELPVVELEESSQPILNLNSIQDISKSQALKHDMLALVNDNDAIEIDASNVERIDGTALQLLCALFNYAQQNNMTINWIKPSDALMESAKTLGLQSVLKLA
ncbi:hypothetical protein MNBD_GAMMA08-2345 [hydrothermal vent metagenome]|uniref:Globin family profile domain-containing protein n=1 Tax=hydrothermal vent metagenome TaxID=652676 RepID=A0A3B0XHM2_9ZZZZ